MTNTSLPPELVARQKTEEVVRRDREIGRRGGADHKNIARRIQRHAITHVHAEVGAAKDRGIANAAPVPLE